MVIFTVFLEDERIIDKNQIINNSGTITPLVHDLVYGSEDYLENVFTASRGQRTPSSDYIVYIVQKKKMPEPAPKPPTPAPAPPANSRPSRRQKKDEEEENEEMTESKLNSKKIQVHCSSCAVELKKPKMSENKQRVFLSAYIPNEATTATPIAVIPGTVASPQDPEQKIIQVIKTQLEGKDRKATIYVVRNHESKTRGVISGVEYISPSFRGLSLVEYLVKESKIADTKLNEITKPKATKKKEIDVAQLESKLEEDLKSEAMRQMKLSHLELDKQEDKRKINKILCRIGEWIIDRMNRESNEQHLLGEGKSTLPKTSEKLQSAITRFCKIKEEVNSTLAQSLVNLLLKEQCLGQCHLCTSYYYNTNRIQASVTVSKRSINIL